MGNNHHTPYAAGATSFTAALMNPPLAALDRAITYHKVALVGCDGTLSWSSGTLTWSGTIHIYFTRTDGTAIHNSIAAGSLALADGEFAYVTLSETNDAVLTMSKAGLGAGSPSSFKACNVLVLGYRNAADDGFYPEELAGIFTQMRAGGAYVANSLFNANTILKADSDDTPAALAIPANSLLGRAGGNIDAIAVGEGYLIGRMIGGNLGTVTAAQIRSWLENLDGREQALTCADNVSIDWSAGATARMTFDRASVALTLSNGSNGKVYRLLLKQDATGGRGITWNTTVKWRGGSAPTLSTDGNAVDILTFVYMNSVWYGDIAANFA